MIDARFVPVSEWPGAPTPSYQQKRAPFRAAYAKTLDLLETELGHLRAKDILIQAYLRREDIRNDGWPRSSARPVKPGVIVTFQRSGATMSFPCDRFDGWEDNLRAVALSLQALRMVDRYGVTRNSEQYRGFAALPPKSDGRGAAVSFLARVTGWPESQVKGDPQGAYRLAARALHPDTGGSNEQFHTLQNHWMEMQ
jgi:hypothetical protein